MNRDAVEALRVQKARTGGTSPYVFPNSLGRSRRNNLYRDLKVCYRRAGIEGASVHSMRHTFCTQLARHNVPVQKIMKLAGHKDIETTMVYVNLAREDHRDSVNELDFGLGKGYKKGCGKFVADVIPFKWARP